MIRSGHSGTALYETNVVVQEEFECVSVVSSTHPVGLGLYGYLGTRVGYVNRGRVPGTRITRLREKSNIFHGKKQDVMPQKRNLERLSHILSELCPDNTLISDLYPPPSILNFKNTVFNLAFQ